MSLPDDPTFESPTRECNETTDQGVEALAHRDHELAVVRQQVASALFPRRQGGDMQKIGRFVVERRLGAGAMGVVYAARDPALDRRVAIKLVRPEVGGDRKAQLRLEREARALAKVSHPNIVAIHEVGEHRGQVFLAMEHVQGQSLRAWQEAKPRSVSEVLGMYVQAGRGLAAAHAAGLVHRDFKPDNVLVDDTGRARVVDFGLVSGDEAARRSALARWTRDATLSSSLVVTQTHALVGTPAYMSPEQFEGRAVDARSDQFGFCVALYEALHGRHPFDARSLVMLQDSVLAGRVREPPKRSRVPMWIHRLLLQGLAVEPEQRHPSLDVLLDALAHDPVVRRRQWIIAGGLVLATAVGTYALAMSRGAVPGPTCDGVDAGLAETWNAERRAAIGEAMEATGLSYAGQTWSRIAPQLDAYAEEWTTARTDACVARGDGRESDRQHDLRVACLERRRAGLEALVETLAEPTSEDVENAAVAVASLPLLGPCSDVEALAAAIAPPEDPEMAAAVEEHRRTLARAQEYEVLGRYDEARALANAVLASPEVSEYEPLRAEALLSLGAVELAALQFDASTEMLSQALEVALRIDHVAVAAEALARRVYTYGQLHRDVDVSHDIPLARALVERSNDDQLRWLLLNNIGASHTRLNRLEEAKAALLEALEVKERVHGREHFEYGVTLGNLALVEGARELSVALEASRRQLEVYEHALGSDHPLVAVALYNSSITLFSAGRLDAAWARMPVAVNRMTKLVAERDERGSTFVYHLQLAALANDRREYERSLDYIERSLAVTRDHELESHPVRSWIFIHRAVALAGLGRHDEAMAELERGIAFAERGLSPQHDPNDALESMARLLHAHGDADDALAVARRALAGREARPATLPVLLATTELEVAKALHARGDLEDALATALRALERFLASRPDLHYVLADFHQALGDILLDLGRPQEALAQYETGHHGLAETAEPHTPKLALLELGMARALVRLAGPEEARVVHRASAERLARTALASFRRYSPGFDAEAEAAARFLERELEPPPRAVTVEPAQPG